MHAEMSVWRCLDGIPDQVRVETADGIMTITMNRPHVRNAVDRPVWRGE